MNNDELKKKIIAVLGDSVYKWFFVQSTTIGNNYGELRPKQKFCINFDKLADALIAAGIGDVKDLKAQVDALEITNIALLAGYDGAEKDRLYWVNKYKEAEHRAEIAERAGKIAVNKVFDYTWDDAVAQAEEELAEEKNDD